MKIVTSEILKIGHLLVVDDSEADHAFSRRVAERSGRVSELTCVSSAEEALEFLSSQGCGLVDLILLDINMPKIGGFEFLELASSRFGAPFSEIPLFMLTASLELSDLEQAGAFPSVRGYISKPLAVETMERIACLLEGKPLTEGMDDMILLN